MNLKFEYSQLSLLFKHLKKHISKFIHIDIEKQLKLYFYAQILIRSGGVINDDIKTIPFSNIDTAKDIVRKELAKKNTNYKDFYTNHNKYDMNVKILIDTYNKIINTNI
jgi:hypothetical protein